MVCANIISHHPERYRMAGLSSFPTMSRKAISASHSIQALLAGVFSFPQPTYISTPDRRVLNKSVMLTTTVVS